VVLEDLKKGVRSRYLSFSEAGFVDGIDRMRYDSGDKDVLVTVSEQAN